MDALDELYRLDLGWPFTSEKTMSACPVCGMGVFSLVKDLMIDPRPVVHIECLVAIQELTTA